MKQIGSESSFVQRLFIAPILNGGIRILNERKVSHREYIFCNLAKFTKASFWAFKKYPTIENFSSSGSKWHEFKMKKNAYEKGCFIAEGRGETVFFKCSYFYRHPVSP